MILGSEKRYRVNALGILLILIIGLNLSGCKGSKGKNPLKDLTHIKLSEDAVLFTFNNTPRIYSGLVKITLCTFDST